MVEERMGQVEQQLEVVTGVLERILERIEQLDKLIIAVSQQKETAPALKTRYLSDTEAQEMFCTPDASEQQESDE